MKISVRYRILDAEAKPSVQLIEEHDVMEE
jgi:hypothetical protein